MATAHAARVASLQGRKFAAASPMKRARHNHQLAHKLSCQRTMRRQGQTPRPAQVKRQAWAQQMQLPPHLYGQRRGTQRHENRLRAQRMGRHKHRDAAE